MQLDFFLKGRLEYSNLVMGEIIVAHANLT